MTNSSLDKRLLSCADYVRAGAVFADIGTDHGYLPIFLLEQGRIRRAVLSDINKGPLDSARSNVASAGLTERCEFVLTDGAAALADMGITDYAIAGMGGELIASIIANAPGLHKAGIRFILQPMTKQAHLRSFLMQNGFCIIDERYTYADGKFYVTMLSEYDGKRRYVDPMDAELGGRYAHDRDRAEFLGFMELKTNALNKTITGKRLGGVDSSYEERLVLAVNERIKDIKGLL